MRAVRHGTTSGYVHGGCREQCCGDAMRAKQAARAETIARTGQLLRTTQGEARELSDRVQRLIDRGVTKTRIAKTAGISPFPLQNLAPYQGRTMLRTTHQALTEAVTRMERTT